MIEGYRWERRRYKRWWILVLYTVDGPCDVSEFFEGRGEFEGKVIDLSEGGLALLAQHYLPVRTKLTLRVIIYETDHKGSIEFL